jgi:protoporphyrinogen oxidase
MKIAVVGAGMLGLALGFELQKQGHRVHIYDQSDQIGGLACGYDYGAFTWDKFYHVLLPSDLRLIEWLEELNLASELVWKNTRTGLYVKNKLYSLSNTLEMLRFPLLSSIDKGRMAFGILYGSKIARPGPLFLISAKDWLTKYFGRRNYEFFWRPLLVAKFGVYAERVAAVFIWATLKRLYGARSPTSNKESMGYVRGGYTRVLSRLREVMEVRGGKFELGTRITKITTSRGDLPGLELGDSRQSGSESNGCWVQATDASAAVKVEHFDHVVYTAPETTLRAILAPGLALQLAPKAQETAYLGVICVVIALREPLTPFYILNIADDRIPLTGLLEMTNLIGAQEETKGLCVCYLPRYLDSRDPMFERSDEEILEQFIGQGLRRLFPDLTTSAIVSSTVHRARYVQPLPLTRGTEPDLKAPLPTLRPPFQVLNTALLTCATLNVNEIVGLARDIAANGFEGS